MSDTTTEPYGPLTTCGPLCDRKHVVDEPHNRNLAPTQPQDHRPPSQAAGAKAEAVGGQITFEWDGESWSFDADTAQGLEFLAALEDADSGEDVGGMIRAMRILLGREDAARLFKGRKAEAIHDFFTAAAEAGGMGNR